MTFTLPYPPALNHLYATYRGRRIISREGRAYKTSVALLLRGRPILMGPICVSIDVYRPRKAGDLDGRFKVLIDSLTGVIWKDDSQVVELHARRFDDKTNPRAEVSVREASK